MVELEACGLGGDITTLRAAASLETPPIASVRQKCYCTPELAYIWPHAYDEHGPNLTAEARGPGDASNPLRFSAYTASAVDEATQRPYVGSDTAVPD